MERSSSGSMSKETCRVRIVGAGMAGMSAAIGFSRAGFRNICIYEYSYDLGFVGAGIQLAPNMARILDRFGVWSEVEREAVRLDETSIRRSWLGSVARCFVPDLSHIQEAYKWPHMVGHRSSLANALYTGCNRSPGVTFRFGVSADTLDLSDATRPKFTARSRGNDQPYTVEADILIGADGIKSKTRIAMLGLTGEPDEVEDTGSAAYRIMLTREQMQDDPELLELIDSNAATRWIGERRHIIAYPISNKTIYNLSTSQPDVNFAEAPSATYTTRGSKDAMLSVFSDFCPRVQKMLRLVPDGEVCEWKLRVHAPLATWVAGSCALVGDSCHPTLPHLAQGAAQAIEDGAVLEVVFSALGTLDPSSINRGLALYERVRRDRAYALVEIAAASGRALHLPKGAAQEERDHQFAASKGGKGHVPDRWADAELHKFIYADCIPEAIVLAKQLSAQVS